MWVFYLTALLSFFLIGANPVKATYPCSDGYYCIGTAVLDLPVGCTDSCTQAYSYTTQITCGGDCTWSFFPFNCCDYDCKPRSCQASTNCCAAEDECTPSCGGGCGVAGDGCGGSCACVECGPYGSQTCGNWTQTYNCSATVSGCNDCLTISPWSACGADHMRTRTCSAYCGGCSGVALVEDCIGTVTGTLFDASDLTYCPGDIGTNPVYASLRYGNESFGLTGTWPVISLPVSTDASGNYAESVYASTLPAVYNYDYTDLINFGRAAGVKLECQSPVAVVSGVEGAIKDTGFWRVYGGWWQAVGGSVYASDGIKSSIPASVVPASKQKLILADANGRSGMLSYGVPWTGAELGTNQEAEVSTPLWRIESVYEGLRYDYNFYNTRMDIFPFTAWDGGDINYNDGGTGYQILKYTGNVTLNYGGPTGTQKVILLIDGDVAIDDNVAVPDGAFLMVMAKGNITFGSAVTKAEGWFVAENINIPCKDVSPADGACDQTDAQFVGEGSFVGWTNINLGRDMKNGNNTAPAEKFIYRPDMLVNIPTPMKVYTRKFSPFIP